MAESDRLKSGAGNIRDMKSMELHDDFKALGLLVAEALKPHGWGAVDPASIVVEENSGQSGNKTFKVSAAAVTPSAVALHSRHPDYSKSESHVARTEALTFTEMKTSAIVLAAASVAANKAPSDFAYVNDNSYIDYLNSQVEWKAAPQPVFEGKTFIELRHLYGADLSHISNYEDDLLPEITSLNASAIPTAFNAYTQWTSLMHPIRDQDQCGSCWAFSSSEAFSDRSSIAAGKLTPVLSPEDMVACDNRDDGCKGGQLPYAWYYIKNSGITTDACMPYMSGNGTEGECRTTCADGSTFRRYHASEIGAVKGNLNIQKEIMTNGPIQVAFKVYKSFLAYDGGIYTKPWYELIPEGGHAVKLVGWGTEDGQDYWTVANSWTTKWGENGFFRIARGVDECGIETMGPPYAGTV